MLRRLFPCAAALRLALGWGLPAQATILTFEIFDPGLSDAAFGADLPFEDPGVAPFLAGYGYPEGFPINPYFNTATSGGYGTYVSAAAVTADGAVEFRYGDGGEGFTPNVSAYYGPYSIFTGGPNLWREGFSDLDGVLYQGSNFGTPPIGTDYNFLDIVLVADPGFDVILYGFDLGSAQFIVGADGTVNRTVGAIEVYDGVPFPFLTPANFLTPTVTNVAVLGSTHYSHDFGGTPLQSPVIWLRINGNNLGADSQNIGIDNIRFGQIASANEGTLDPAEIDAAFLSSEDVSNQAVPEPASLALWLVGGMFAGTFYSRRKPAARANRVA